MHPINKLLASFGLKLSKSNFKSDIPKNYRQTYRQQLYKVRENSRGFKVFPNFHYDAGIHPTSYIDFECEFASRILSQRNPTMIMDIGSYRHFILGLLASFNITTLDVRKRESSLKNETVLCSDAKQLDIPSDSLDAIVSLCTLEHFGLGRYGDELDLDADLKAFKEMRRVLKPNGILIFTTTITRYDPSIAFNVHRIYNHTMISAFCEGLELGEEVFFSNKTHKACTLDQVTTLPKAWDVYCGYWIKVNPSVSK